MKNNILFNLSACLAWIFLLSNAAISNAETAESYNAVPPFVSRGSDSNVLLNLSIETPMQGAAYNDQPNDINGDGDTSDMNECSGRVSGLGRCYFKTKEYFGIFDPNKAYDYSGGRFIPVGATNANHETSGHYSGNFLNWATMTAIDEFRWTLTGGRRVTDTTTETVIGRANMALSANHSWYPYKRIRSTDNVHPNTVTPFNDTTIYIYNHGYQVDIGTSQGGHERAQNLNVSAKVCDPTIGLEDNCVSYGTYYKPEGLIQNNANRMRFAVMSYALDNNQSRGGGVLRSNMKYVGPTLPDDTANPKAEYGTNGLLYTNPEGAAEGNSGVINYVNKFGANGYKSYDPVGELFYECLNYYKNRGRTPEYADGLTAAQKDGFPAITTWEDPIQDWCQPNYIVGINDANPWLDKKLPGTHFTASTFHGIGLIGGDYGTPGNADAAINVKTLTNTVGQLQGINGTSRCVGYTDSNWDGSTSNKNIPGLGEIMGTCPSPGKQNSYYVAGLAYYANTQDIRPDLPNRQTVSTFMIDTQEYNSTPLLGEMNMLWLTGKYGGFEEKDNPDPENLNPMNTSNQYQPNLVEEWDADADGEPDNYVLATDPEKLINGLTKVFSEINKRSSSATAASVISGSRSGEGAIYQSVFYPEYQDNATPNANRITWAGSVHASFVDELGRMREDTNHNRILDINDKVIIFKKIASTLTIEKYSIIAAIPEKIKVTLPPASASLAGSYFILNTVSESFYIWFTVDGSGADPRPAQHMTGIKVALAASDTSSLVATKTAAVLDLYGSFEVPVPSTSTITITLAIPGNAPDATPGTSGVTITVEQQGAGETTHLDFTGNAEDIDYLWNTNTWLNTMSDTDIINQRTYTNTAQRRHIFTFIDANQNKVADSLEQRDFVATGLPPLADLSNTATLYPYIPINSDSETLPPFVSLIGGNRDEFLQKQTQRVINYTRGLDQDSITLTTGAGGVVPAFRSRKLDLDNNGSKETTWRLGDIVHSSPTVVNKPREALHLLYKDTSYATFADKYQHRRTVLYTGANDGMLHAFNGGFYEDRFDVYPPLPAAPDRVKDIEYLLQPKDRTGTTITTGFSAHNLGAELWAYVPYNLLPHLYWPTEQNYGHVYYVDLKPRVFDAKIFTPEPECSVNPYDIACIHPDGWGTVLVGGMRFGGGKINIDTNRRDGNVNSDDRSMSSAYFIIDITNPEKAPTVLGELSFPHLGYTTCYPTVAALKDKVETATSPNRWFLIFGSGPAEADGSPGTNSGYSLPEAISKQKAKLYAVDLVELVNNKLLRTLDTTGAISSNSPYYFQSLDGDDNAFVSDPITVDIDLDYKADTVYYGTVSYDESLSEWGGKLRRIVIDNDIDTATWDRDSVLIDLETSHNQPITAAPTAGLDPDGNIWIFFGTGRYFVRDDALIFDQETYYGIKEPRHAPDPLHPEIKENSYAEVFRSDLFDSTNVEVNSSTKRVNGGLWTNALWGEFLADVKTYGGWYHNLIDARERNIGQAALFGDLVTFTSYVPSDDICEYEGYSYLYALYYQTGTAPIRPTFFDSSDPNPVNHLKRIRLGQGLVSKPSLHVGEKEGSTVFVQTSEGAILAIEQKNPGSTKSGTTSWGYRQ